MDPYLPPEARVSEPNNLVEKIVDSMNDMAKVHISTGQMQMQTVVLQWLNRNAEKLPSDLMQNLADHMEFSRLRLPSPPPTYWDEKSKERRDEFAEEDARSRGEA
jgi:hypothetical protein